MDVLINNRLERLDHIKEYLVIVVTYPCPAPGDRRREWVCVRRRRGEPGHTRNGEYLVEERRWEDNVT